MHEFHIHFIGDAHGKTDELNKIIVHIPEYDEIFQVGDMGVGFVDIPIYQSNFHFIRGNHDNPEKSNLHKNYLADYGGITLSLSKTKIFFIGGAYSIDGHSRMEGISYWNNEELNYQDLVLAIEQCIDFKPEIIITHDCPYLLYEYIQKRYPIKSKTNMALNILFEKFQPKIWIYGHHHKSFQKILNGTHFIGLEELEMETIIINKK